MANVFIPEMRLWIFCMELLDLHYHHAPSDRNSSCSSDLEIRSPYSPARHRSLVVSAAYHPLSDGVGCDLKAL